METIQERPKVFPRRSLCLNQQPVPKPRSNSVFIPEPFTVIPPIPKPRNILKRKQSQVETGDETMHFDGLEFCPNVSKIENHELQSWMNANCSIQPANTVLDLGSVPVKNAISSEFSTFPIYHDVTNGESKNKSIFTTNTSSSKKRRKVDQSHHAYLDKSLFSCSIL